MIAVYSCARSYIDLVETYIERCLKEAFPGFEMDAFMQQLQQLEQEMDGSDVLEVLLSFEDSPLSKVLCSRTRPRWRAPCSTLMSAAACCISRKYAH